ncbi:MAG: cardiolipin synthase [Bacteroidales bacterium]|nr:cardiolipin synthase [Bacteroidales bacterium]
MFFEILYFLILASSVTLVILENRNPKNAMLWVMLLTLLPGVGLVVYLLVGKNFKFSRTIKADKLAQLEQLRDTTNQSAELSALESPRYAKLTKMMDTANHTPLYAGNEVSIFTSFSSMFDTMMADIAQAESFIHLQFYKIENDEVGKALSDMLIAKAQSGVEVRLIYDALANWQVSRRYYRAMKEGGVKVEPFLKVVPSVISRDVNCRTHRKIVVVDGRVGYTGGMNIARRYRDGIDGGIWRDTQIRIVGPAVSQLQLVLLADWYFCTKRLEAGPNHFPPVSPAGNALCQVVASSPMDEWNTIMQGMVQAIAQSTKYCYIQTPYFMPTEPLLLALRNAALAGVDVRIMMPAKPDRGRIMLFASRSFFKETMVAGVKIYLYNKGFLHAKTLVCDDDFVTIGSTNIDSRSLEQNFEANVFVYSSDTAKTQRDIFLADQADCTQVDPVQWPHRPFGGRVLESVARLLTPLL